MKRERVLIGVLLAFIIAISIGQRPVHADPQQCAQAMLYHINTFGIDYNVPESDQEYWGQAVGVQDDALLFSEECDSEDRMDIGYVLLQVAFSSNSTYTMFMNGQSAIYQIASGG